MYSWYSLDVLMISPYCTYGIPLIYWTSPNVLMVSPTCIMISPRCTEHSPMYSWYPPDVLMICPQCTHDIQPMYSWYPPNVLNNPLMYWTSPVVLNTHYTGCLFQFACHENFVIVLLVCFSDCVKILRTSVSQITKICRIVPFFIMKWSTMTALIPLFSILCWHWEKQYYHFLLSDLNLRASYLENGWWTLVIRISLFSIFKAPLNQRNTCLAFSFKWFQFLPAISAFFNWIVA